MNDNSLPGNNPQPENVFKNPNAEKQVDPQLLNDVLIETKEHLENIEMYVLQLENEPDDMEFIHSLFREFHTIKGLAGFVNQWWIEKVAHGTETLLNKCRKQELKVNKQHIDIILKSSDVLKKICADIELNNNVEFCGQVERLLEDLTSICPPAQKDIASNHNCIGNFKSENGTVKTLDETKPVMSQEISDQASISSVGNAPCPDTKGINTTPVQLDHNIIHGEGRNRMPTQGGKFLTLSMGTEEYGIPIQNVIEIMGIMDITTVPKTPKFIKGVINLRGKIIPVMDLRLKFGLEEKEYNQRTCIIVVEINTDGVKRHMGIIVDTVLEVLNIQNTDIESPPEYGMNVDSNYIDGMGKVKDKVVLLLNIQQVINHEELAVIKKVN